MKSAVWLAVILFGLISLMPAEGQTNFTFKESEQIVLVTTPDWNSVSGRLSLFETSTQGWKQVGSWPIVVGRNGLAWGKGMHPPESGDPQKREGDGKSPAGIFKLSSAFGSEPSIRVKDIKLPYLPLSAVIECVDDANSQYYNAIVNREEVTKPDWNSSEKMLAIGEQYRLGVVVDHNFQPRAPGHGSCIFLHIWKGETSGTAGCTAMDAKHMERIVRWLDPVKKPLLVQLPVSEYERLQQRWKLPAMKQ